MGLDITIYKENKKGKRHELVYFCNDGWPIINFIKRNLNKSVSCDSEVVMSLDDIQELINGCKDVLIAYYERSFENSRSWLNIADFIFHSYDKEYFDEYNDYYIDSISTIYRAFWNIQEELYNNETIILNISY